MTHAPLHAFLAGRGRDSRGRSLPDILAFDDEALEGHHDFIQWLFPLREASRAVPGSPVLGAAEAEAIRRDPEARRGLTAALERMTRFYRDTGSWLTGFDHNHLRITRILTATRDLLGEGEAQAFHQAVVARDDAAGNPINSESRAFWRRALDSDRA